MAAPPDMPPFPDYDWIFKSWWPLAFAAFCGFTYAFRQYMRGAQCISEQKLTGKTVIVTGANQGIGKCVALDLAKREARVILACRNEEEGKLAVEEIKKTSRNDKVILMKLDLTSFKSIREFAETFKKKDWDLHILVNNAGVSMCPLELTGDEFESQFQTNYLGPFLLTHLLLDKLKASAPSKVVNVTAPSYRLGDINFDDINLTTDYSHGSAYAQSKLALVLASLEIAKRFQDADITVLCANPGVTNSNLYRHIPIKNSTFVNLTFGPLFWYFTKCPEDGAQTVLVCCLLEEKATGKYYSECAEKAFEEKALDEELQEQLWKQTLEWLKIKEFGVAEETTIES